MDASEALAELNRAIYRASLYEFVQAAWHQIESAVYIDSPHIQAVCDHLQATFEGKIDNLIINIPPGCSKSLISGVFFPAWAWANDPTKRFFHACYDARLAIRDSVKCRVLLETQWYQETFPGKVMITKDQNQKSYYENTAGGWRMATSVGGHGTGEHPHFIVVDDPNNVKQAESAAERQSCSDWWTMTMPTRGISLKSKRVIIQQRLHEQDLTGVCLEMGGYDHLCLPMRFDGPRPATSIGFVDWRHRLGQLLAPLQFDEETTAKLEKNLGPYGCNPAEAPILMSDLTNKPISQIAVGDEIIGFDKRQRSDNKKGRHKLTHAKVLEVHRHIAPVVVMTLDSGEKIRCTRDHKWFTKDRGSGRKMYLPAILGVSRLARVCPPSLPVLTADEQRDAGWLSGFYDGEGTVSLCRKNVDGQYRDSAQIHFYQGAGRNLPLCEKLERLLEKFGFAYSFREDHRKENKTAACYGYRKYKLLGNDLPLMQRFLHIVQPTKWRDRIINGALGAKFIKQRERVIAIEDDGEEMVYALTTTTGNYIVWGLASSNSAGQLQQRPVPRSGGLFKADKFEIVDAVPMLLKECRYWDTAASAGKGDWTAGVRIGKAADGLYYISDVVRGQWSSEERMAVQKQTGILDNSQINRHVTQIQAEEPGSAGKDQSAAYVKMMAGYSVETERQTGSKEVRADAYSSQVNAGNVKLLRGVWNRDFIEEHKVAPNGKNDDQWDAASGGFNWLENRCGLMSPLETENADPGEYSYIEAAPPGVFGSGASPWDD